VRVGPPIEIEQRSRVFWRGIGLGGGVLTLSSLQNSRGETEYTLSSNHSVFGLRRHFVRTLRYVGEDKHSVNGHDRLYHVLRDVISSQDGVPITAYVEKMANPRVYLVYAGIGGEVKVGPEGETVPI
jgi:hypothetical protein